MTYQHSLLPHPLPYLQGNNQLHSTPFPTELWGQPLNLSQYVQFVSVLPSPSSSWGSLFVTLFAVPSHSTESCPIPLLMFSPYMTVHIHTSSSIDSSPLIYLLQEFAREVLLQLDQGIIHDELTDDQRKLIETIVSGCHNVQWSFSCVGRKYNDSFETIQTTLKQAAQL